MKLKICKANLFNPSHLKGIMPQTDIKAIEKTWLKYWEKEKIYAFNPKNKGRIYAIDTPPPYISGNMHIGHAFSYSQQDFIARFKRMSGFNVFYPFGTDDNGLPTERWIEKTKNIKSKDMSRSEFIEIGLSLLKEKTPELIQDWKDLGISSDFNIYYSTIDPHTRKISQESFLELYKKGHIYREEFPTIYCPECQTPVAQAELEDTSLASQFSTLKFSVEGKDLPIATTRPELLAACVAVFVNPKDKRYKSLIGKTAKVPLFNHEVPILADESAEMDKGSGVLMVCSYGDKYDVDAINRHKIKPKVIFNPDGTLNIPEYKGLSIKKARSQILEDLKSKGLIIKQEPISHAVNVHDKCGTEIEFIPIKQWFIKILNKKTKLIAQGKKINWYPKFMQKRYDNWIKGLEWDWSISRDRHFGIPIPVWHCSKCHDIILPKPSELPIDPTQTSKTCPKCNSPTKPETNVLDTWATSSLTPQIASGLINNKIKLPYSLRPQGHDIIRTWAFYTIVKSLLHESQIPWKDIVISGFTTLEGKKMSRSTGKSISPKDAMAQYGSDALRYWAAGSKLGDDLEYQEKDLVTGKKFITKILNATNFVFMNLKHQAKQPKLEETDRVFLSELNSLIKSSTEAFQEYNYSKALLDTQKFFWQNFADNYLEIVKGRVYNGTKEEKASASYTLYQALLTLTKLFAPITPFITEEIYQSHFKKHEKSSSIHIANWPSKIPIKSLRHDDKIWNKLIEIVSKVRQEKSKAQTSMKAPVLLTISKEDYKLIRPCLQDLQAVTAAKEIKEGSFSVKLI